MKTSRIVLVLTLIGIFVFVWKQHRDTHIIPVPTTTKEISTVAGCYIATLAKDVYTLNIASQDDTVVEGTLAFKNFEKDSSSGTFKGTFVNDILLADYTFGSEGMTSVRQVAFKKTTDGFVEGFGPVKTEGDKEVFSDVSQITYDQSPVFTASACI